MEYACLVTQGHELYNSLKQTSIFVI